MPETAPKCPHCGMKFKDNRGLSGHIRYKHKGESYTVTPAAPKKVWPKKKPKPCPHCDKTYKNLGALENHILTAHGGESDPVTNVIRPKIEILPLKCPNCSKHFKSHLWLDRHVSTQHSPTPGNSHRASPPSGKSHLDLAIEEIEANISSLETQIDKLRDGLDILMAAREDITSRV